MNGTFFVALYADGRYVGTAKLPDLEVEAGACLRKAVAIPAAKIDPANTELSVKLMLTEPDSYQPMAEFAAQLDVTDAKNMPDYRYYNGDGAYTRQDEAAVYEQALGEFAALMSAAKQAETNHKHAGDGAGLKRNIERRHHALFCSGGRAHIGTHRNIHANKPGKPREACAKHEAKSSEERHAHEQDNGHHGANDGNSTVLALKIGLSSFLDGSGDALHILVAGGGTEHSFGRLVRIVQRKGSTGEHDNQGNKSHITPDR